MKKFRSILFVADFSVPQETAVERAVSLAKESEATLTVLTVAKSVPPDLRMTDTGISREELGAYVLQDRRESVDALVGTIREQDVDATARVVSGTPFLEIIRQVLREGHDLVILGAEGRGGLRGRLFGSTSMHLMRKCPCPVWVVKPATKARNRRILAAVDLMSDSELRDRERRALNPRILDMAAGVVRMGGGELHVVQVWSVFAETYMQLRGGVGEDGILDLRRSTEARYARELHDALERAELSGVVVHTHLPRSDEVAGAIVETAEEIDADLLVMGTLCRIGLAGFFIGNTAEEVLSRVNCSVLTIKPEGFVTPVTLKKS